MRNTLLVAGREFSERLRSKSFLLSIGFFLLVAIAAAVVPVLLEGDGRTVVGVVDASTEEIVRNAEAQQAQFGVHFEVRQASPDEARALLEDGELDAAVVDRRTVLVDDALPRSAEALLQSGGQSVAIEERMAGAGWSSLEQRELLAGGAPISFESIDPESEGEGVFQGEPEGLLALVGVLVLFGLVATFGQWVSQGIVEEKQSRVVEVLLSTVSSRELLAGKVLGLGALGLLSVLLVAGLGVGGALGTGIVDLPEGAFGVIAALIAWFLLGYVLYSTVFAIAGALVPRVEELQSTTGPVIIVLVAALFSGQYALFNPGAAAVQVLGYFPFTSPIVQPVRTAIDATTPVEVALSAALAVATILVLVPVAARIYERGVLQTRSKLSLRRALGGE
ncbi:ABC transporter permease [Egibacter rhizosphaerae]|uniref:ABC transporter permease n=1 Tax=Egibacter rhizosphaerae TaxID=1670831 RepID=A0A411YDW3_9ACTN|nr:ABC transporter permease [Egibacter rhizosphaerae]QBI19429.1 ABC transporter permease [Egibacter rhizosphaerae]